MPSGCWNLTRGEIKTVQYFELVLVTWQIEWEATDSSQLYQATDPSFEIDVNILDECLKVITNYIKTISCFVNSLGFRWFERQLGNCVGNLRVASFGHHLAITRG